MTRCYNGMLKHDYASLTWSLSWSQLALWWIGPLCGIRKYKCKASSPRAMFTTKGISDNSFCLEVFDICWVACHACLERHEWSRRALSNVWKSMGCKMLKWKLLQPVAGSHKMFLPLEISCRSAQAARICLRPMRQWNCSCLCCLCSKDLKRMGFWSGLFNTFMRFLYQGHMFQCVINVWPVRARQLW